VTRFEPCPVVTVLVGYVIIVLQGWSLGWAFGESTDGFFMDRGGRWAFQIHSVSGFFVQ
jgi:hypothetical protein